ncbi:hypothetical protein HIM_00564 [Hirsutella minnesotensis 3608]|nr:hypothetical protein HIM_00564 [Hirsutella minnesotensis 3608]
MSRPSEAATVVDDEQMTVQCCVPLASLSRPVEVSKLGYVVRPLPKRVVRERQPKRIGILHSHTRTHAHASARSLASDDCMQPPARHVVGGGLLHLAAARPAAVRQRDERRARPLRQREKSVPAPVSPDPSRRRGTRCHESAPTFLCYLRLAVYMAILSVAITLSFHLNHEPTHFERRMAKPLGLVFWLLSVAILLVGVGNYISSSPFCPNLVLVRRPPWTSKAWPGCICTHRFFPVTINKYGRKKAIVQTGWKTQLLLAILALSIIATCVVLLLVPVLRSGSDDS